MDEMLNIELTGIQQEWSLDILLNESIAKLKVPSNFKT